ncbi:DUF4123 domain-containing protein [Pseudomonas sp. 3A(2025)]
MRNTYLLLDSAQIDELPQFLLSLGQFMPCHPLYLTTVYAELADCGPLLVPVVPGSQLALSFIQRWRMHAGIWLETDAPEPALLDHLRSLVHVSLEGKVTAFFRYHDPRIARLWLQGLQPIERDRAMGPIQLIRLPAEDGSDLSIVSSGQTPGQRYAHTPWLQLSAAQLEHLGQAQRQQFDRHLIEHCQRYFPSALHGLDNAAQHAWAQACQLSAGRQGYSTQDEVTRWVSLHVHLGANFPYESTHQAYRKILEAAGLSPAQRLDGLLSELTLQLIHDQEPRS